MGTDTRTNQEKSGPKFHDQNHVRALTLNTKSPYQRVFAYFWNFGAAMCAQCLFRVFNKTFVEGRENLSVSNNLLLVSNHQTLIDSFFIGSIAFWPKLLIKPSLLPWHPAALENFFQGKFIAFCSKYWKCIPVKRSARDFLALHFMIESLEEGTMLLFPEGTRSRSGKIGRGKIGVGKLIYDAKPTVIPVAISGMDQVLPVGVSIPRFFKLLWIKFGEPLKLDEFYNMEGDKETSQEIVERIMTVMQELKSDVDQKMESIMMYDPNRHKVLNRAVILYHRIPVPLLLIVTLSILHKLARGKVPNDEIDIRLTINDFRF